jgi:adenine-specific DNA-methyltransferase
MKPVVIENPILNSPFEEPASGRIAVKVINHYGDEVLKVYPVRK